MNHREELRLHLREEPLPEKDSLILRGGPDSASLIRTHARRTHRLYCLDGQPLWGISVFAALDPAGPSSRDGLLAGRLATYEQVHIVVMSTLTAEGFGLLPTFRRPHYTLRLTSNALDEAERLLRLLGQPQANPYNPEVRRRRQEGLP